MPRLERRYLRLGGGTAASILALLACSAPAAQADAGGLPPPTAANLHPCSRVSDELSPWKDRSEETGYTVWGTLYAYDWWGKRGSCSAARFVAVQVVDNRGPASVSSPIAGSGGHAQRCYVTTDDAGHRIEPFASIYCHIRHSRHNFGVLVAPYPAAIDGWFWNDGNAPSCTTPDSCPTGPPNVPEADAVEVDTLCELKHGAAVCSISSNPGASAQMTVTLSRGGRQLGQTSVVFTDAQVTTVTVHGRKRLKPGLYDLHVVVTYNGATVTDAVEPLELV